MQSRSKPGILQLLMDSVFRARLQRICRKCSCNAVTVCAFAAGVVVMWMLSSQHQLWCFTDPLRCTALTCSCTHRSLVWWQADGLIARFSQFSMEVVMGSDTMLFVSLKYLSIFLPDEFKLLLAQLQAFSLCDCD